jgi:polyribonucleotide nucleotidyltransferase
MFENYHVYETELAGRKLTVETGKVAQLANGSCLVRYGETAVLVTATASQKPREGVDFFPLAVEYEERLYAVGKIPGSFLKREGRPSEKAVLTGRMIDRQIRPLFPKDMRNDVTVDILVFSVEKDCQPEVAAMIGASIAISISDIPWNGPTAGVAVGYVDGQYVVNPGADDREKSDMYVTVAGTRQKVVMIEAGAKEVSNDVMYDGIMRGHEEVKKFLDFVDNIIAKEGKPKFAYESTAPDADMFADVLEYSREAVKRRLTPTTRLSARRGSSPSTRTCSRISPRSIRTAKPSSTNACTRSRRPSCAAGCSTSTAASTDAASMRSARSRPRSDFSRAAMVRDCLPAARLR